MSERRFSTTIAVVLSTITGAACASHRERDELRTLYDVGEPACPPPSEGVAELLQPDQDASQRIDGMDCWLDAIVWAGMPTSAKPDDLFHCYYPVRARYTCSPPGR